MMREDGPAGGDGGPATGVEATGCARGRSLRILSPHVHIAMHRLPVDPDPPAGPGPDAEGPARSPGLLITFEGVEGAGKSTQVELLRRALAERAPVVVREPGGTALGERLRKLLLDPEVPPSPEAEMYLFMAARAELVARVIAPALASGRIVIADRYHDSTLAYQGGGRGLATWWPASFPRPQRTFLLELAPELGLARQGLGVADRFEAEGLGFHRLVADAYRQLAAAEPGRFVRLDASRPPEEVHAQVMEALADLLSPPPSLERTSSPGGRR
ncbi:MAG TPA: dTMP kinase [Candidatus Dormibacteraeota bacterium]|nr:dTMP kinase [Candidatus Dormibacteraeota bacterium]